MLKKVWIKGFRNLKEVTLTLDSDQSLFFLGENNQGKTNFLESIFFLGHGLSPIEDNISNLVHFEESEAYLGADFVRQEVTNRLYFKITKDGKRVGFINNKSLKVFKSIRSLLNIDFISADIIRLFQDYPDQRRVVLDRFCSVFFSEYQAILRKYEKVIKQKNMWQQTLRLKNM